MQLRSTNLVGWRFFLFAGLFPHPEDPLDKLIAATALIHGLTLVTRNTRHVDTLGVRVLDPFAGGG